MEVNRWCPAFFLYLTSTLPTVWLLELKLQYNYISSLSGPSSTISHVLPTGMTDNTNLTVSTISATINVTNVSASTTTTTEPQSLDNLLDADTWIIFVEQSLVYMLVICRWLLPRGNVSRDYLSDLLLEFLAIASDIMELLAIFAEEKVKGNISVTYTILTIWSLSFIQFIPVLVHKRKYRHVRSPRLGWLHGRCGDYFAEVTVTCMSIIVQDGPFLIVRLYVIVGLNVVTYGLAFFVLKNILTILLLLYRLFALCIDLPCCYEKENVFLAVDSVDFSKPVELTLPKPDPLKINETLSRTKEFRADKNGVLSSPVT
ncbi:hypothetical protein CHS0354_031352 [Potamilus streckersoni]|uniref:Transmembrane protein 26 n=1 Tax=Potamilus streckersoni TaxID=2493646 RepID=A0AAE0SK12_9BIVA|nr:hypothetical protein CHS0354_031352 [Potamilus streckersoni]